MFRKVKIIYLCNQCTFARQEQSSHNAYGISERDNISSRDPQRCVKDVLPTVVVERVFNAVLWGWASGHTGIPRMLRGTLGSSGERGGSPTSSRAPKPNRGRPGSHTFLADQVLHTSEERRSRSGEINHDTGGWVMGPRRRGAAPKLVTGMNHPDGRPRGVRSPVRRGSLFVSI